MHRWLLHVRRLDWIGERRRRVARSIPSSIDSSTTKRSEPSGRRTRRPRRDPILEADVGGEPGEQHSFRREHPPHLVQHAAEVRHRHRAKCSTALQIDRVHAAVPQVTAFDRPPRNCSEAGLAPVAASLRTSSIAAGSPIHTEAREAACEGNTRGRDRRRIRHRARVGARRSGPSGVDRTGRYRCHRIGIAGRCQGSARD